MMNGKELAALGKSSPAAAACIPLELIPTVPRLRDQGGWVAEYWYYPSDYRDQSINAPVYYLALELPGGHPVSFSLLRRKPVCLGKAPEILTNEFYVRQNAYLDKCAGLMEQGHGSARELEILEREWLQAQPEPLRRWFSENREASRSQTEEPRSPEDLPDPENLVDYWKQEMARAIQKGDPEAAGLAQREMTLAAQKSKE